ncbi:MAG: hypothetical protein ABSB01_14895 [Streptosporangiaceae bacterium]
MQKTRSHRMAGRAVMALPVAFVAACSTAAAPVAQTGPAAQAGPVAQASTAARQATGHHAGPATAARAGLPSNRAVRRGQATESTAATAITAPGTTVPGASGCPMFPANNVWNTDISKLPVNSHSAAWLRSMASGSTYLHPDFGPDAGGYPYGITYNVVTNAYPMVRIRFEYATESDNGPYPFGPGTRIEGGRNADGDRHAIMVNKSTCMLYELYDARYSAKGSTAGSGAIWNLRSNALRPAGWTSADAAGLPILPGLLNFSQIEAAVRDGRPITHAIRFTAQTTRTAYLWPARHEAGSSSSRNLPPMGARFRLKASFEVARFCRNSAPYCKDAKAVLTEMQHYGLILADNGSNWYFGGSAFPQWPDALVSLLKGIPARDFQGVNEACLMLRRYSGEATAKPGCPIG